MLAHIKFPSPVGPLTLVASSSHLVAVSWDKNITPSQPTKATPNHPILNQATQQLTEYFVGTRTTFTLLLAPQGTPFQQQVWALLATIPYGETRSYGQLAEQLGTPNASRAVGAANGQNPLGIILPCHRVIGAGGSLTGFAGGLPTKRWLLAHEQQYAKLGQPAFL